MKDNICLFLNYSQFCILNSAFCIFLSAFLIFNSAFCFGQQAPGIEWQNTIGGSSIDQLNTIKQTTDGGYIFAGNSFSNISGDKTENSNGHYDLWVVKTDSIGNIQWQNTIGGSNIDYVYEIVQTNDGGYIMAGASWSNISGDKTENCIGNADYWLIKIDVSGNIVWQNTIGGNELDYLESIQQTTDGGYILGGLSASSISGDKTENTNGFSDFWIVKTDSLGNIQWQNTIGGIGDDQLYSIKQTIDNGYILGGWSKSNISGDKTENCLGDWDYWVVKTDSMGSIQWDNTYGGDFKDRLFSIQQTFDGGYILGGASSSNISGDKTENNWDTTLNSSDFWIIKIDPMGNIDWQNTIGGTNTDNFNYVQQTIDGGYIVSGWSLSNLSGDKSENSKGSSDFWIIKLDSIGIIQWQKTIGGNNSDMVVYIQQTLDRGYILAGSSSSDISGDKQENCIGSGTDDYWVVKLYPDTTTGTSDVSFENYDLKVFPNPAKDEINIAGYALQNNQPAVFKIYDVMGKEVFSQSIVNRTSQIVNLKSFTNGIYFVQLQTGAKVSRVKFVKQ